jgi:hypothetical protein
MTQDWTIQGRAHQCSKTGKPFAEGEHFYTLLFHEKGAYRREDLCEEAFKTRGEDEPRPFSYWRAKYVPPPPAQPETVSKQTAEDLLRAYMEETGPDHTNARYILALMLERKRILKEVEVKHGEDGSLTRIYEHGKTGEVFVIPDPQLKLGQVEEVQRQVADLLSPPPAPPAPAPTENAAPVAGENAEPQPANPETDPESAQIGQ